MNLSREERHEFFKNYARDIFMTVAYNGRNYNGWQIQSEFPSVQQKLNEVLTYVFANQLVWVNGSSRTDAGVHALNLGASFKAPAQPAISDEQLFIALNKLLPYDIRITSLRTVTDNPIHARFDAKGKAYTYVINRGAVSPFNYDFCWHLNHCVNVEGMREAAKCLIGTHDYSSFVVEMKKVEDATRTIYDITIDEFGDNNQYIAISFIGNGFLYKMVRCLVGTLAGVGINKITASEVKDILLAKERNQALATAPAAGLFLMKVFYEQFDGANCEFKLTKLPFNYF
ncbi:tRNA pseudouridine(38-40) synthase TruA [Lentisphaerota bacterium WC36G]|nr:tRNA pseudouridine(38-40) synthase TruA [Lentisphaerae bacterium WC36]